MKFFVSVSSISTSRLAEVTQSPNVKHFNELPFKEGKIIPDDLMEDFERSDVVVINGTWGNDLRKNLYLKKNEDTGELILNSPDYRHSDGSISYKIRSAILDAINTEITGKAIALKKPIVVFESATISRAQMNYTDTYNMKSKFRIGLNSWIYKEAKWLSQDNFKDKQKINARRLYDHNWNSNQDGSIYVLTGLETDPTSTMPIYDFIHRSITTIRKHTDRKIVVKIHPGSPFLQKYLEFEDLFQDVFVMRESIPLKRLYNDMYCAVIDNSTSVFELIDAGIPVFCSKVNFGSDLKNTNLAAINDIHFASKDEVLAWTNDMCCTEISVNFLKDANRMKDLIETLVQKEIQ